MSNDPVSTFLGDWHDVSFTLHSDSISPDEVVFLVSEINGWAKGDDAGALRMNFLGENDKGRTWEITIPLLDGLYLWVCLNVYECSSKL